MKKKVLSLVLALLMTASAASTVLADDVVAISEDTAVEAVAVDEEVEAGQYDKAIAFLANYGIFKGYNADDTGAEDLIQRYQMALFVGRISTGWVEDEQWEDGPENWSEFSDIDVDPVNKYYGALSYANQKGIIEGYGNGKFGPTDSIKYQDALTMVVRTLGYTGLDWPWGYIQKAVELGLTDGITGVAYTDELTRGEVAQIIYNALFATTKNGTTLAMSSFGIEFGWEKIVVTASDLNTFVADKEGAAKKLIDNTTPYYKDSNKPDAGFVTFQILNDDGSLADDVYYVQASELGLAGDHDDELAVGEAYYVLFEKDEDSNLAKIVAYESLKVDTLVNAGKTDDNGEEQEYAIQEFLGDYALVDKYTGKNYVNVTKSTKPEIMVFATNGVMTETTINGNLVAIDWTTGDILVPADVNEDGKINEKDQDKDGNYKYVIEWYYNEKLERYYNYQYDKKYENVIGLDWMSDEEFEDTYGKYFTYEDHKYAGFATTVSKIATSAYASLEVYDTNIDDDVAADRAIYESYRLGYFKEDTHSDSKSYKISAVDTFDLAKNAAATDSSYSVSDITVDFNEIQEGVKDDGDVDRAWFVEGYEPEIAYDEDGEATGYKAGYVIYNYDAETGAIKVVKNVNDGTDEDSYVRTGVIRAYNVTKGTVTIGETVYHIDQYDELEGSGFKYVNKSAKTRACYTGELRELFNQFVTYVVVDGELVHVEACGADSDDVIVVESYAGLSSDGYVVVNGYSTADLEYTQFRLGSIEGWEMGDIYYYGDNYDVETRGMVLTISSYDEEEDVYYVNYAAGRAGNDYYVDEDIVAVEADVKFVAQDDGYVIKYQKDDDGDYVEKKIIKMSSSDKYIIVGTTGGANNNFAAIKVYEGKLPEDAEIRGDLLKAKDGTYVFVNAFTDDIGDTYQTGLVVLLDDSYNRASYNGTDAEDWYLLGAVEYEISVFDVLSGKFDVTKYAVNKSAKVGKAYYTQGDVIENKYTDGFVRGADIVNAVVEAYPDGDTYYANYISNIFNAANDDGYITVDADDEVSFVNIYNTKDDTHKKAIEYMLLNDMGEVDGSTSYRGDKVDGVTYRVITIDEDNLIADITDDAKGDKNAADFIDFVEDEDYTKLSAFYVYDVEGKDIVIYLVLNEADNETIIAGTTTGKITANDTTGIDGIDDNEEDIVLEVYEEDGVKLVASEIGYTANLANGVITEAAITGVKFGLVGDYLDNLVKNDSLPVADDVHAGDDFGYHFGKACADATALAARFTFGTCASGANTYVLVGGQEVAVKSVKEVTYDDTCDLVKGFEIEFAEMVYVPEYADEWTVEIHIPNARVNGEERVYCFGVNVEKEVAVAEEITVDEDGVSTVTDWDTVENVVLVKGSHN